MNNKVLGCACLDPGAKRGVKWGKGSRYLLVAVGQRVSLCGKWGLGRVKGRGQREQQK
jgi:hypothetical protein